MLPLQEPVEQLPTLVAMTRFIAWRGIFAALFLICAAAVCVFIMSLVIFAAFDITSR
jgi:hypothetical protein